MNPEDLVKLVSTEMPYGKHKGCLLADLPGNYLNWFARVGFPPGEIGRLLALMQEIDHNGLSDLLKPLRPGRGVERLYERVRMAVHTLTGDRPVHPDLEALTDLIAQETLL